MGGLVGALYSSGFSSAEMREFVLGVNWQTIFDDGPSRDIPPYILKKQSGRYQLTLDLDGSVLGPVELTFTWGDKTPYHRGKKYHEFIFPPVSFYRSYRLRDIIEKKRGEAILPVFKFGTTRILLFIPAGYSSQSTDNPHRKISELPIRHSVYLRRSNDCNLPTRQSH
ncbi:MAG: hypothetical protein E4H13_09505 [Calditrichales bacterium]|nr:MAG: hypothetical protein E4H13_09505 [Calditrichales bacterium]